MNTISKFLKSETMKSIRTVILGAFLFPVLAFAGVPESDFIGTYGISRNDPAKLELKFNADKTFTYQDLSESNNKIEARGTWELKNNTIILKNYTAGLPIATKLKVEKNGAAVRYRKGLGFYRLVRI